MASAKAKPKQPDTGEWQNRIVGSGVEPPDQLLANPNNWRIHPGEQQQALEQALSKVGWITRVVVNKRTGHLIDGHLRVGLAISKGEPGVPVDYVDLDESEEKLALATLDPLAAMAVTDRDVLASLLDDVDTPDGELGKMLDTLAGNPPDDLEPHGQFSTDPQLGDPIYRLLIECDDEHQQGELLLRLQDEGLNVKAIAQ